MSVRKGPAKFFTSFTSAYYHEPYDFISPSRPELSAREKNVVITGGGTGIGKAIAIAFAQAGAKSVAILGRRGAVLELAAEEIRSQAPEGHGTLALGEVADLTSLDSTVRAVEAIASKVGPIHIFVSNASTCPAPQNLTDFDSTALLRIFELNCVSSLNAMKAFKAVASPESPALIHVSSIASHAAPRGPNEMTLYSVSKAATMKMFQCFAAENPSFHVVNFHPGLIWSEMTDSIFTMEACPDHVDLPGHFCVWLAAPESRFLRGKFLWANWDAKELVERQDEIRNSRLLTWGGINGLGM